MNYSYQGEGGYAAKSEVPTHQPELQSIQGRLSKANSEYSSLLYEIEERLHGILNLRATQESAKSASAPGNIPSEPDHVQAMNEQLSYTERHNERLRNVLAHIQRIIG